MGDNMIGELNRYRESGIKPNFSDIARRYHRDRHTVAAYWKADGCEPLLRPFAEEHPGRVLSEQQQLRIRVGKQERDLDALLEVDPDEVRLLVQAMGQSGVRLSWDGTRLQERRAPWLPPWLPSPAMK